MNPARMLNISSLVRTFDQRELSMFHLGILLRDKIPLATALGHIAVTAENKNVRRAALRAAELLSQGLAPAEVFAGAELKAFPAQCRYILSTPLADEQKGQLLSGWDRERSDAFSVSRHLYYPAQTMIIGCLAVMSLVTFVLPQFREILAGMEIKASGLSQWVINFGGSSDGFAMVMILPIVIFLFLTSIFYMGKIIFGALDHFEELSLFRMLNAVSSEHRIKVLGMMAVPHNFPRLAPRLKSFVNAVNSGTDIIPACRQAGLDSLTSWFIQIAATEENGSAVLEQGAALLETRVNSGLERAGRLLEICSVLSQGLVFGIITYSVFQIMVTIMLGAIA